MLAHMTRMVTNDIDIMVRNKSEKGTIIKTSKADT